MGAGTGRSSRSGTSLGTPPGTLRDTPRGTHPGAGYLPAATHAYLDRAAGSLREAEQAPDAPARYAAAHVAALRATAALLAARARPQPTSSRRRQKNAWVLLAEVAPELAEWATFFAAGASKRAAAEAGSRRAVSEREADDLVRDSGRFLAVVEAALGLVPSRAGADVA